MKNKKTKLKSTSQEMQEPEVEYSNNRVVFFKSFEEESEYVAKERAQCSHEKRMSDIEVLRKNIFHNYLLADGSWPSIEKVFKIMAPYTNEVSK